MTSSTGSRSYRWVIWHEGRGCELSGEPCFCPFRRVTNRVSDERDIAEIDRCPLATSARIKSANLRTDRVRKGSRGAIPASGARVLPSSVSRQGLSPMLMCEADGRLTSFRAAEGSMSGHSKWAPISAPKRRVGREARRYSPLIKGNQHAARGGGRSGRQPRRRTATWRQGEKHAEGTTFKRAITARHRELPGSAL